jgi:hypothetical protein
VKTFGTLDRVVDKVSRVPGDYRERAETANAWARAAQVSLRNGRWAPTRQEETVAEDLTSTLRAVLLPKPVTAGRVTPWDGHQLAERVTQLGQVAPTLRIAVQALGGRRPAPSWSSSALPAPPGDSAAVDLAALLIGVHGEAAWWELAERHLVFSQGSMEGIEEALAAVPGLLGHLHDGEHRWWGLASIPTMLMAVATGDID